MHGSAKLKVQGGKLVGGKLEYGEEIEEVRIVGDFFMHPEEAMEDIERSLVGVGVGEDERRIAGIVAKVVKDKRITMVGITPEAIARVLKMAVGS